MNTFAAWVDGIAELLAAEGLDATEVLTSAGIDPAAAAAPGMRIETEKMSRLWEIAVERSKNPSIALAHHGHPRPRSLDVVGYTMMSCASLREALGRLVRYLRILSDALSLTENEAGGLYRLVFQLDGGRRSVPRQRIEFILVTLVDFCRWITGRDVNPQAVELPWPAPDDVAAYGEAFHCPTSFDNKACSLVYAVSDLEQPLQTSNPILAELHERFAGEYLAHFDQGQTRHRVREVLIRRLPDGEPSREQVARELRMSVRTLQRRLEDEGSSFVQLLDDTRRDLAEQYLSRLHLTLGQACYLLGYADQSSFFRACKRWFGVPPREHRRRLRELHRDPLA